MKLLKFKPVSSLDKKKILKKLDKGKTIKIDEVVSSRAITRGKEGQFSQGNTEIYDFEEFPDNNHKLNGNTVIAQRRSSAIDKIRYEPKEHRLYITYVGGGDKEYAFDVSPEEFESFMNSGSKGRYVQYIFKEHNKVPRGEYE